MPKNNEFVIMNSNTVGRANRTAVYEYFAKHLCHSNKDAAKALGLSPLAVGRHAQAIRSGWRPEGVEKDAPVGNEFFSK